MLPSATRAYAAPRSATCARSYGGAPAKATPASPSVSCRSWACRALSSTRRIRTGSVSMPERERRASLLLVRARRPPHGSFGGGLNRNHRGGGTFRRAGGREVLCALRLQTLFI